MLFINECTDYLEEGDSLFLCHTTLTTSTTVHVALGKITQLKDQLRQAEWTDPNRTRQEVLQAPDCIASLTSAQAESFLSEQENMMMSYAQLCMPAIALQM